MRANDPIDIDPKSPPFDRLKHIHPLATERTGRSASEHARHHLYVGRDVKHGVDVLIKAASKPGLIYQQNLANEIASLTTINRELPGSPYFPIVLDHGRLRDGRLYLMTYLFSEFPLATIIGAERVPARTAAYLRIAIATAKALADLHRIPVIHVDLNPMNILHRAEQGTSRIRIIDFESSYEPARHAGALFDPPTTASYCAPELSRTPPDARADIFSLGAVLYTLVAGYDWTWNMDAHTAVKADGHLPSELRRLLLKALAADPARRYESMESFSASLSDYLERLLDEARHT